MSVSGLYFRLRLLSGGVTEAAGRATTTWRTGRGRKSAGRLWSRSPLQPQPGNHGARSQTGAGRTAEAARAPDEGAGEGEGQAAAGGGSGHDTRSASQTLPTYKLTRTLIYRNSVSC